MIFLFLCGSRVSVLFLLFTRDVVRVNNDIARIREKCNSPQRGSDTHELNANGRGQFFNYNNNNVLYRWV